MRRLKMTSQEVGEELKILAGEDAGTAISHCVDKMKHLTLTGLFALLVALVSSCPLANDDSTDTNNQLIKLFQQYLQMDTSNSNSVGIAKAVAFWKAQAARVGLEYAEYSPSGLPIPVLTWPGTNPSLPSIVLNHHMDVVAADASEWTYPPYSGHIDTNGDIYARGTQDTKGTGILYLEALRRLKAQGVTFPRTIHMTVMPDEELGGFNGMVPFVKTADFKNLNVGFVLDEGAAQPSDTYMFTYHDKRPWQPNITVHGETGHGGSFLSNTALQKIQYLINTMQDYRAQQQALADSLPPTDFGGYTTLNINLLDGGYATNVVPGAMSMIVDIRLASNASTDDFQTLFNSWIEPTGNTTTVNFLRQDFVALPTPVDDTNPYWVAIEEICGEMNMTITTLEVPATTDMVPIRALGIPALGFNPCIKTPIRIHGIDELVNVSIFLAGVPIYMQLISKLANMGPV